MDALKASYGCAQMGQAVVLPSQALVTMTVFDFISGVSGEHIEQLTFPLFEYFKTPLRASSGAAVESSVFVNHAVRQFTGTAAGNSSDNPTDPQSLTDAQASKGVQFFFRPQYGYIDATYLSEERSLCRYGVVYFVNMCTVFELSRRLPDIALSSTESEYVGLSLGVREGYYIRMVLEAMKMEHALTAPFDGIVTELSASQGSQVQVEAVLAVVEPKEE